MSFFNFQTSGFLVFLQIVNTVANGNINCVLTPEGGAKLYVCSVFSKRGYTTKWHPSAIADCRPAQKNCIMQFV